MRAALWALRGAVGVGVLAWLLGGQRHAARPSQVSPPRGPSPAPEPTPAPEVGDESSGVRGVRLLSAGLGLAAAAWGAWLLLGLGSDQWLSVGIWLAGGVVGHDFLLAPLVVLLGVLAVRLVPAPARAPLAVGLIVWGSLTLLAVPVLGRFGALADNPTLLDRPYQMSWWILTAVAAMTVAAAAVFRARRLPA